MIPTHLLQKWDTCRQQHLLPSLPQQTMFVQAIPLPCPLLEEILQMVHGHGMKEDVEMALLLIREQILRFILLQQQFIMSGQKDRVTRLPVYQ